MQHEEYLTWCVEYLGGQALLVANQADRQAGRQTGRQAGRQAGRKAGRKDNRLVQAMTCIAWKWIDMKRKCISHECLSPFGQPLDDYTDRLSARQSASTVTKSLSSPAGASCQSKKKENSCVFIY